MMPMSELEGRRLWAVKSQDAVNRVGISVMSATVISNTQLYTTFFATIDEARTWTTAAF